MCTNFQIKAKDGSLIIGRSMEFGTDLKSKFYVHRRGDTYDATELESKGLETMKMKPWSAHYGYVGLTSFHIPATVDGMNEAGLSVGALWLPGTTYQKVTNPHEALPAPLLPDFVLANCATIEDVINLLPNFQFWLPDILAKNLPLHFPITDAKGNSIVVEFQNGELKIHQNPVGVCTNAPWFPWHIANLGNYTNLTGNDTTSTIIEQLTVEQTGHGTGLAGLPGNSTPPSRFVRIAFLRQCANQPKDANGAMNLATHLLNSVDIAKGTIKENKTEDYTQWSVIKDLTHSIFAVRTYDSMMFRAIDLKKIDFAKIKTHTFAIPNISDVKFLMTENIEETA